MVEHNGFNWLLGSRIDRPASTLSAMRQKEPERQLLALQVAEYLKSKKITHLPSHMSKNRQMIAMRDNEMALISFGDLIARWDVSERMLVQILFKYPLLLYITKGKTKYFALDDIQRIETIQGYKSIKQPC